MTYCGAKHPAIKGVTCGLLANHGGAHMAHDTSNPPSNGWHEWPNDAPPPALGVSVSDGIATKDKFGG